MHYLEEKIVRPKKRAARVIADCDFYTPSSTMVSDVKWMSIPERVICMKAIQMFKTIMGDAPEYLRSSFTFASDIHARLLRSSSNAQLYTKTSFRNISKYRKYVQVHPFGTHFLHIWSSNSVQHIKGQYLCWVNPNVQGHLQRISQYPGYNACIYIYIYIYYTFNDLWRLYDAVIE